jgi:hypothetical protein
MSTMTAMMKKLGTSPVNADTAAAKSRINTNGLVNRSIKASRKLFRMVVSIRFKDVGSIWCAEATFRGTQLAQKIDKRMRGRIGLCRELRRVV